MSIKVLTIDDDPAMTEFIGLLLQSHGLEVIACNESRNSMEVLLKEKPDIVLLDLMMPGQDGWDICQSIRAFSNVPIAILSAIDDPIVISSALDAGADDYMVKPVAGGVLIAHINNLMRRHQVENNKTAMLRETGILRSREFFEFKPKPVQA